MKKIVKLTEGNLRYLIESSVKDIINERINYNKGVQFINESMVMPYDIERV